MIIYIVTSGRNGRIEGAFENRKQAAYLCAIKDTGETKIEEWDTEGVQFTGESRIAE